MSLRTPNVAPLPVAAGSRQGCANVHTFVRLHPCAEKTEIELFELSPARPSSITIKDPLSAGSCAHSYQFDQVFSPSQDQQSIFHTVARPVVESALAGQNGCVLAYGQTGSGKTYSILGGHGGGRGVLPRAAEHIFLKGSEHLTISFSLFEVYLDTIKDLGPAWSTDTGGLEIRENLNGAVYLHGLANTPVRSAADVQRLVDSGLSPRAVQGTAADSRSSRSHTIFTFHLHYEAAPSDTLPEEAEATALPPDTVLSFVDLAGSERLAKSRAEGERFREAVAINTSLTAIGKVILALSARPVRHVPYRDSKLSRILSQALQGNSHIALLATLRQNVEDYEESLNTLSFASRCKHIEQQPRVTHLSEKFGHSRIADLQAEAEELRQLLHEEQLRQSTGSAGEAGAGAPEQAVAADARPCTTSVAASPASPASPAIEPHFQTIADVLRDRRHHAEVHEKVQDKIQAAKLTMYWMEEQAKAQQSNVEDLDKVCRGLKEQLKQLQNELKEAEAAQTKSRSIALEERHLDQSERLCEVDNVLLGLAAELHNEHERRTVQRYELSERLKWQQERQKEAVRQLVTQHSSELSEREAQLRQRLVTTCERNAKLAAELSECREQELYKSLQCQKELLSLSTLVARLSTMAADTDRGAFAVVRQDGMKQVLFPDGLVWQLPSTDTYPQLFAALSLAEQKVSTLERRSQRPLAGTERLRQLMKAATGGYDGMNLRHEDDGSGSPSKSLAAGADVTQYLGFQAQWDARAQAAALCSMGDPVEANQVLSELSAERLRELCVALRTQSLEVFSPGCVRDALRKEAEAGVEAEATQRYVRTLEKQRDLTRADLAAAVERTRNLRIELESKRNGWMASRASTPLRTTGTSSVAWSRSQSRNRTPVLTPLGSQPVSRSSTKTAPLVTSACAGRRARSRTVGQGFQCPPLRAQQ